MNKKKVLVLGANGQLGTMFRDIAPTFKDSLHFTFATRTYQSASDDDIRIDIINDDVDGEFYNYDVVINCAAYTNVDNAETENGTKMAMETNAEAVKKIAKECADNEVLLVHISTDFVFDGRYQTPYTETMPCSPINTYGVSKVIGEQYIIDSKCKYLIFRTSSLYSEFGNNFFTNIMKRIENGNTVFNGVNDVVSSPTYARDLANFICRILLDKDILDKSGIYHFANEGACSKYGFLQELRTIVKDKCELTLIPCKQEYFKLAAARPQYTILSKDKTKKTFNNFIITGWCYSLRQCYNNYIKLHKNNRNYPF